MEKYRVKFYGIKDLGSVMYLLRMREVLDNFIAHGSAPQSVEDAIEYQNIISFIENEIFSRDWGFTYIEEIKKIKPKLKNSAAKYLGTIGKNEILASLKYLNRDYYDDFFRNFASYRLAKKISEDEFGKMVIENKIHIIYLLKSPYLIEAYPNFLKSLFCISSLNIELLLQNYTESNREKLYFPDNITKAEWNALLDEYIDDNDANLNYLSMLENPIKNLNSKKYFTVSPNQKLRIKKEWRSP